MRFLFVLIGFLATISLFADQDRRQYSFKSKNGFFELKPSDTIFSDNKTYRDSTYNPKTKEYVTNSYQLSDRFYWGLYDLRTNKKLYTIKNDRLYIETKTALISENGKNVIIVDDYSGGLAFPSLEIVHFFNEGKLLNTLKLGDVLHNMCSVSYSVSHMRWCFNFKLSKENKFTIETYEYLNYIFDINGTLIGKYSDESILPNDDIVSAKIKRLKKNRYKLTIVHSIRGKHKTNSILTVIIPDKTMRKIHGKFYGFLPSRNKKMNNGFYKTFVMRNNKPFHTNFWFPSYNSQVHCNFFNKEVLEKK
ncbi:MAG: hypothetical protein MK202_02385 [Tenacibaculum sp.]|nr:hypothetical protein [Tenacibaculum sp.]